MLIPQSSRNPKAPSSLETHSYPQGSLEDYAARHSALVTAGPAPRGCCPGRSSSRWVKALPTSACWGSFEKQRREVRLSCLASPHTGGGRPQILEAQGVECHKASSVRRRRVGKECGEGGGRKLLQFLNCRCCNIEPVLSETAGTGQRGASGQAQGPVGLEVPRSGADVGCWVCTCRRALPRLLGNTESRPEGWRHHKF